MKQQYLTVICFIAILISTSQNTFAKKDNVSVNNLMTLSQVNRALNSATEQALFLARSLKDKEGQLPRSIDNNGILLTKDFSWWCSGFFPGVLWMLYENQPSNKELRELAELFTKRVEGARNVTNNHDVGFMLNNSYGHAYRITGDEKWFEPLRDGAKHLADRFMPGAGVTRSWEPNKKWKNPVIIDNMMNLELLENVGKKDGIKRYIDIANTHAHTTMKNHYRPNYSTWHVIDYDANTGEILHRNTAQGYADESDWARGQMWGLYGYSMMYRETKKKEYLKQAQKVANYLTTRSNWPEDKVPYWDFDCPDIPNTVRDASSAAIMASALIELSTLDKKSNAKRWLSFAEQQLKSLSTAAYTAEIGKNGGFILMHSTGSLPAKSEIDVPLSYADYYYVEALLRLKKILSK